MTKFFCLFHLYKKHGYLKTQTEVQKECPNIIRSLFTVHLWLIKCSKITFTFSYVFLEDIEFLLEIEYTTIPCMLLSLFSKTPLIRLTEQSIHKQKHYSEELLQYINGMK